MELYIIRHGETDWNKQQLLQGTTDTHLNEYGIELAEITSEALKDVSFDKIYSSPLSRAYQTAKILKRDRELSIIRDDRLHEMSFGIYEGRPAAQMPGDFENFFKDPVHYQKAPQGESYEDVIARATSFVQEVIVPDSATCNRIMVVAHGSFNRGLMLVLNHGRLEDYWKGRFQHNCCVNIYTIEGEDFHLIQDGLIYYELQDGKDYGKDD